MSSVILELNRTSQNENSMFGVLSKVRKGRSKDPVCNTLENKWENNKQDISCIPPGIYEMVKTRTGRTTIDGNTFKIMGVPQRTDILFHIGNTHLDTLGCILTISEFGRLTIGGVSLLGGYESKKAFGNFMAVMSLVEVATILITRDN